MYLTDYNRQSSRIRILRGDIPDWIRNSPRVRYISAIVVSTLFWIDRKALNDLKDKASYLTKRAEVPWNLEVTTWEANSAKSNHWNPCQLELFDCEI